MNDYKVINRVSRTSCKHGNTNLYMSYPYPLDPPFTPDPFGKPEPENVPDYYNPEDDEYED